MKTKNFFLLVLCTLLSVHIKAADGDTFTANTQEGIVMSFKIISEIDKTVQVGNGSIASSISQSTSGAVTIPQQIEKSGVNYTVVSIGYRAFYYCEKLTSVTIPNSVKNIGKNAFNFCYGLTSVNIPNSVTNIGEDAFGYCKNLTSITIPQSVTSIGEAAFYGCGKLTTMIVDERNTKYDSRNQCNAIIETSTNMLISGFSTTIIPNSVTSIANYAFAYLNNLSMTSIVIPNSVKKIGNSSFRSCRNLTTIKIPNSVECIGDYAFESCSNLTSIIISNGVTSIGQGAFDWCGLTSLTIPNSVTSIGRAAFSSCKGLTSVISKVTEPFSIDIMTFDDISSSCTLTVPSGTKDAYIAAGWTESVFKGGIVEAVPNITFADANVEAICVANWDTNGDGGLSEAEAAAVTDLGTVFQNNKQITSFDELQYFTGLTSIGTSAFYLCNGLRSVIIPNNVTSIDQYGFCDCSSLTSVTFSNNVTSIGNRAFQGCSGLTTISIPNSVTSIGYAAFSGCSSLTTVSIPNSVTSIGYAAFSGCSSLTTVSIPNNVTSIVTETFDGCSGLTSVSIPNGVTSIGNSAFRDCSGLTSVTIPNSVTSIIGSYAFKNCTNLTSVISEIEEPSDFNISAFQNISSTCTLTVPYGTKDAYFDKGWSESFFKGGIVELDNRNEQSMELASLPAKTYGDAAYTLPATTTQGLALTWSSGNTNVATISGNTLTVKGAGTATITASQVGNEEYKPFSKEFALTVAKAPLTITAQDFTRYEGEENPAFTVSYEGFVKNEDATVLTTQPAFTCDATSESSVGTYGINVSGAEAANYEITYVKGTLTITEKPSQTISLTSLPSMTYGDVAYTLPAQTEEGFDLTWASSNTAVATISGNTLTVKGAGTATITASQVGNEEYKPFCKEFALTVAKAPLTITVNDATKNVGDVNPAFTASYEGFVGDDDASVLTAQPTFTTEADENSPVGTYAIVVSGAEAANYEINYVNGTLTVVDEWSMSNTISLTDTQVLRGRQVVLPVSMNNTEDITALQFDLTLPAGVSIAVNSKGKYIVAKTERCADHTLSTSKPGEENVYKVLLYSTEVESITGNEGAVIHVTIEAAEDMEAGDYEVKLSNINLTTTAEKKITPADVTCVLTVRNSIPGDANGDGEIDVTDIVGIANSILGRAGGSFDVTAADVNGDGEVDVTDIVAVANIILRGGKANSAKVREAFQMLDPQ